MIAAARHQAILLATRLAREGDAGVARARALIAAIAPGAAVVIEVNTTHPRRVRS